MPKSVFIISNTDIGTMIVNRNDCLPVNGVGSNLLEFGSHQLEEVCSIAEIICALRKTRGDGVIVIDGGANLGTHTVSWAKLMHGWGQVIAVECQERTYYALAGNLAINNLFNAQAIYAALSNDNLIIKVPQLDPMIPNSFGWASCVHTLEGSPSSIGYLPVRSITIDSLNLPRCDLIKLDLEGMELLAISGAKETIKRFSPVLIVEHIWLDTKNLKDMLPGYLGYRDGMNTVCVAKTDAILADLKPNRAAQVA